MRRKPGQLVALERSLIQAGVELAGRGVREFHGYAIAKEMRDGDGARRLTGYGTLYRALERLEEMGLVASRWEDPQIAADGGRPRRRLYRLTAAGERADTAAPSTARGRAPFERGAVLP
jgi:hypothetical protein